MRKSGILLHVSSLPSNYGIGTFGSEAYRFIDFLKQTNQSYWQILPLGPTSYGDSPYQTFSVNALNPYFIDLDILVKENLLKQDEITTKVESNKVDYGRLYKERFEILKKAFKRFNHATDGYQKFLNEQKEWVYDYALFIAIKKHYDDISLINWPLEVRTRNKSAISKLEELLSEDIKFQLFIQYEAYKQFMNLKKYANNKGINIIGDIPIYVAYDSSDVWINPSLFQLNDELKPTHVAGVPPDGFTALGQLWGNPLYNWANHEKEDFKWWIKRIESQMNLFDMIRIDHFIGFENYYSIPATDTNAINGKWEKGPGIKLFKKIKEELGDLNIIAEDLGVITDDVRRLLKDTGFPGMKLLQFAFDSREESDYIPYSYDENSIAYTGTHDNETTRQWFNKLNKNDLDYCLDYINCEIKGNEVDSLIKVALSTKSKLTIIPMQDYLNLGEEARMNIPSTLGGNWMWRLEKDYWEKELEFKIARWTKLYGRK